MRHDMYFDALTLAAVADELEDTILGGRIQRVVLTTPLSVALEIYARGRRSHLLLSAHPQFTRVHLSATKPSRGVERDTPLLLLLRKYVVGGRIAEIEQPELERVLVLSIVKGPQARNIADHQTDDQPDSLLNERDADLSDAEVDELEDASADENDYGETWRCELIVEAMERRGNIILVGDDNLIMESARHITPRMSHRPVQPHAPYELPPRQEKRDPRHATPEGMRALLDRPAPDPTATSTRAKKSAPATLARALVADYLGLSPLAAREAVFRATGQADTPLLPDLPWAKLALAVRSLWNDDWQPCLAGVLAAPHAYAPYLLTQLPDTTPISSISAALDAFYSAHEQLTAHNQRRDSLRQQLLERRERIDYQRQGLSAELKRAGELDRLRWEGEMIYAFMHTLVPGQVSLVVEERTITLDPTITPVENAQERFRAYDKAKSAMAGVPERLQTVEARLAGLDETLALLDIAEGYDQIEGIAREAMEHEYIRAPVRAGAPKPGKRLAPLRIESSDGFAIYIGRSAGQNEQVTFKIGASDDLWLHARGIPGAHVIIKNGGREVPETTLQEAAALAAYHSQARAEPAVEIDIARRGLVRRIPNGPIGLVSYQAERTIRAAPHPPQ
jgi:predicted ribosome quality control (RQC) complex YloA/Tae2 family protein